MAYLSLSRLVEVARGVRMDDEQRNEQRSGFVYGNTRLENSNVTRELVDAIAQRMPLDGE